jgi:adenylate cyclase
LSSRYPGAQREDAIKEAGHLEFVTGRPTKVVKDTYYPDSNRNEEFTAYLSPKGRALQAVAIPRKSATAVARRDFDPNSGRIKRAAAPPRSAMRLHRTSGAETTVRIVVAIGASVLFATIITAAISTVFGHIAKVVPSIPADSTNAVMAGTYLIVFLYTFPALSGRGCGSTKSFSTCGAVRTRRRSPLCRKSRRARAARWSGHGM